jgi:DNA-binding MarR family transcriptional regulator
MTTGRTDARTQLLHDALDAYLAFAQALHTTTARAWQHLDFCMLELKALMAIAQGDTLTVAGLAAVLKVVRSEASRTADALYRRGLITRVEDQDDRRRSLLRLTGAGQDLVGALLIGDQEALTHAVASLEPADLQRLAQGLLALLACTPGAPASPAMPARDHGEMVPDG